MAGQFETREGGAAGQARDEERGALRTRAVGRERGLDEDARQAVSTSALKAASGRSSNGSDSTYWRTGTSGRTRSTRCAAPLAMRRPVQLGQIVRPWHEKATSSS